MAAGLGIRAAARHYIMLNHDGSENQGPRARVAPKKAARAEDLEMMEVAAMAVVADDAQALSLVRAEMTTVLARSYERSTASSLAGPFYADRAEGQL